MIVLSHPTGNSFVRQALEALAQQSYQSYKFYTTINWPRSWPSKTPPFNWLARRSYPISSKDIVSHPWREVMRLLSPFSQASWNTDAVYHSLDRKLAKDIPALVRKGNLDAVYCYEDGAYHTFEAASDYGIERIYDLPIGHYEAAQALYKEEAALKPQWASTLTGLKDSQEKLDRKTAELQMASKVVIASTFTASTVRHLIDDVSKLKIIPYGAPAPQPFVQRPSCGPLKVLYVGSLTQRKGISYLFDAVKPLGKDVKLTVIGRKVGVSCPALDKELASHQYFPSLPHSEILQQMQNHDVLVFPSLFEGFGLVLTEALSCGLPIIATANTAAPDLIEDKKEGFIIPLRSADAITQKLQWAIDNRDKLAQMQRHAWDLSHRLGWESYRKGFVDMLYAS